MKKDKIGTIFIISILALAGLGITYAGWTDTINITGTVNTGTVDWDIIEYSGTWVYKIDPHGREIIMDQYTPEQHPYEPRPTQGTPIGGYNNHPWVAAAWAEPGTQDDTVKVTYENIYPADWKAGFSADIKIEYKGTVPGRINSINPVDPWPDTDSEIAIDQHTTLIIGYKPVNSDLWIGLQPEQLMGMQLHQGDLLHIIMNIVLPQDNTLMNLDGSFEYQVEILQWNDACVVEPPVDPSLVGYWKLDDQEGNTATDSSTYENHGTLMPASPVWTTGIINGALDFDGIDDYVEIPDDPSLDITDEITLMAWVNPENWDHDSYSAANSGDKTTENAILTKADDSDWGVWNLHYKYNDDDGRFGFRFEAKIDGTTQNVFETTPSTDLNTWYHIAGVYDGSEMKLYVNGVLVNSAPVSGSIDTNDMPLRIGKQLWWSDIYSMWDGKIDEVKIYNRALSDIEIEDEYNLGTPITGDTTNTITINEPGPQYSSDQYGYDFDYSSANVEFTYENQDTNLRGTITATGLKPYCTYQVKLLGIPTCMDPTGDDMANEYIGYKGRWTCTDCGCSGAGCNRNDAQYLANSYFRGDSSECIAGYLVFEYFTADENGEATKTLEAETSYHVLYAGGGTCNSNNNDDLYYPDAAHPGLAFSPADKVNGQPESGRGGCGGLTLDADTYHCTIALTEESFHQGNWATVLEGTIDFEII